MITSRRICLGVAFGGLCLLATTACGGSGSSAPSAGRSLASALARGASSAGASFGGQQGGVLHVTVALQGSVPLSGSYDAAVPDDLSSGTISPTCATWKKGYSDNSGGSELELDFTSPSNATTPMLDGQRFEVDGHISSYTGAGTYQGDQLVVGQLQYGPVPNDQDIDLGTTVATVAADGSGSIAIAPLADDGSGALHDAGTISWTCTG